MSRTKKIDVSQITGMNFSSDLTSVLYGGLNGKTNGLVMSIEEEDKSFEAIRSCGHSVDRCSTNLAKAAVQMNQYMNDMAYAFEHMDKSLSSKIGTTTNVSVTKHSKRGKTGNRYKGKF